MYIREGGQTCGVHDRVEHGCRGSCERGSFGGRWARLVVCSFALGFADSGLTLVNRISKLAGWGLPSIKWGSTLANWGRRRQSGGRRWQTGVDVGKVGSTSANWWSKSANWGRRRQTGGRRRQTGGRRRQTGALCL